MILPWQRNEAPAFALLIGESGVWIGFACSWWAIVAGPRYMVEAWAKDFAGRRWSHSRGWWATAGPIAPDTSPEGTE